MWLFVLLEKAGGKGWNGQICMPVPISGLGISTGIGYVENILRAFAVSFLYDSYILR